MIDKHEQQEILTSTSIDKDFSAGKENEIDNDLLTDSSIAVNVEPGTNDDTDSQIDPKIESDKASHLEVDREVESQENMKMDTQADCFYTHSSLSLQKMNGCFNPVLVTSVSCLCALHH